jgi:serine/threonine protein kinase
MDSTAPQFRHWASHTGLARLAFANDTGVSAICDYRASVIELDLDDPAQRILGDFELLELIGQGGMGVVYRARQRSLQRDVAIKLLSSGPLASDAFVARFQQEAQHAAHLQHPGIVTVYELGEVEGLVYFAMELVTGRNLAEQLSSEGASTPRAAAAIVRTIAEAVDYAHRLGVLHLDLKPGNILLDANGQAKVADFGLARRLGLAQHDDGHISGTLGYMAPEQVDRSVAEISAATDLWGLGAILYELLTTHRPFEADDPVVAVQLARDGNVRRPGLRARVPADLEAICMKCLQKHPAQRYSDARALADDLGRFIENRAVQVRPLSVWQRAVRWTRREPRLAIASGLAVLALVVGLL